MGRCAVMAEADGGSTVVRLGVNLRLTTGWSKGQEKGNQRVSYQGAEEIN